MPSKDFSEKVQTILKEYGYAPMAKMPVQQAQWPETPSVTAPAEPTNDAPVGSETTVVTNGETKPLGEPRDDIAAQNGKQFDADTMGEVGSLLITIGHLLAKDGHVGDKFDTPAVLAFLTQNFQVVPSVDQAPDAQADVAAVQPTDAVAAEPEPTQAPMPMGADYMEQRKMFESKFKK